MCKCAHCHTSCQETCWYLALHTSFDLALTSKVKQAKSTSLFSFGNGKCLFMMPRTFRARFLAHDSLKVKVARAHRLARESQSFLLLHEMLDPLDGGSSPHIVHECLRLHQLVEQFSC